MGLIAEDIFIYA